MDKRYVVAICTPVADQLTIQFTRSFSHLVIPGQSALKGRTHVLDIHGHPVDVARNFMTAEVLSDIPDLTHVLWIDDDMQFPPDALQRLLAHDVDIVGGLCHNRRGPSYHPIVARLQPDVMAIGASAYAFVYDLPESGLVECDATGGAFLLIKADVLRALKVAMDEGRAPPNSWWKPFDGMSEDFSFCKRAREAGYKIYVDAGLNIGHVGEVVIDREAAGKLRRTEWNRWWPASVEIAAQPGQPVATIVIPTYNQNPKYLKAAVLSALNQTVPVEVIVVDDGTTNYFLRTPEEAASGAGGPGDKRGPRLMGSDFYSLTLPPQVKLLRRDKNRGISAALNTGIAAMSTEWFCWLSSDDLLSPDKVATQLTAMLAAGAKASFHDYGVLDLTRPGEFTRSVVGPTWRTLEEQNRHLRETCCINGSTVMIHKSVFDKGFSDVAPFDVDLRYAQDWEMWLAIAQKHLWLHVAKQLGTRREGENLTAQFAAMDAADERRQRRDEEDRIVRARYARVGYVNLSRRQSGPYPLFLTKAEALGDDASAAILVVQLP